MTLFVVFTLGVRYLRHAPMVRSILGEIGRRCMTSRTLWCDVLGKGSSLPSASKRQQDFLISSFPPKGEF